MRKGVRLILIIIYQVFAFTSFPQANDYPYLAESYDFIRYDLNRFNFYGNDTNYTHLHQLYDDLILKGEGKMKIVHIGGSHIQADIYSNRMRKRLQTFHPGMNGGRGFVFPYSIAGTTNPSNYYVRYSGEWESCRNVETKKQCVLGLSGILVATHDTTASFSIKLSDRADTYYDFNIIRIFYENDSASFNLEASTSCNIMEVIENKELGYRLYKLDRYTDSVCLSVKKTNSFQDHFIFYGMSLETEDPGVVYHSIGINGAKLTSYLRCNLLEEHLKALEPDWIILSIGTNDANYRYFKPEEYKQHYDSLISIITRAIPGAAILLTVPNDSYLYRRYVNRNTEEVKKVIEEIAVNYNCGVWDFYTIMGGLNSIVAWQHFNLAARDRIHFTVSGYLLMGDLFFDAFLKSYEDHLDMKKADLE
ncbi:MAG: hypothetical protein AMS27_07840 [Bacteroides sp. SM23_62_1]|nr:MAG: hypothetical protein AMS27_07840 [Bacteroides sp. SM23_62_1]